MDTTITLTAREVLTLKTVLANAVVALNGEDETTFHGGLGADACEFCTTLLKLNGIVVADAICDNCKGPSVRWFVTDSVGHEEEWCDGCKADMDWSLAVELGLQAELLPNGGR